MEAQRLLDGKTRRAERAKIIEKHRHVKVGAPFARTWVLLPRRKGVFEIEKTRELAVLFLHRLRQIDRLGVSPQCIDNRLGHLRHVQRRGFLKFEDRDAGVDQLLQTLRDVLVFHGLMADVEYDAEM